MQYISTGMDKNYDMTKIAKIPVALKLNLDEFDKLFQYIFFYYTSPLFQKDFIAFDKRG